MLFGRMAEKIRKAMEEVGEHLLLAEVALDLESIDRQWVRDYEAKKAEGEARLQRWQESLNHPG